MRRGDYPGGGTTIVLSEDGTVWPTGPEEAEKRFKTWEKDGFEPATPYELALERRYREYGAMLIAAFAQCYHRRLQFEDLPKVPIELAQRINRVGGVVGWINCDPKRHKMFWRFVSDQAKLFGCDATDETAIATATEVKI